MDALSNSFIKYVARTNPVSLSEALTMSKESERIYSRLNLAQRSSWVTRRKNREEWSSSKTYNRQGYWDPRTMLRVPKFEGQNDKWSKEGLHTSERSCDGHGKRTDFMNHHYCERKRDERTVEGKTREMLTKEQVQIILKQHARNATKYGISQGTVQVEEDSQMVDKAMIFLWLGSHIWCRDQGSTMRTHGIITPRETDRPKTLANSIKEERTNHTSKKHSSRTGKLEQVG